MLVQPMNEGPENGRIPFSFKSFIPRNLEFGQIFNPHLINVQQFKDERRAVCIWRFKNLTITSLESFDGF